MTAEYLYRMVLDVHDVIIHGDVGDRTFRCSFQKRIMKRIRGGCDRTYSQNFLEEVLSENLHTSLNPGMTIASL